MARDLDPSRGGGRSVLVVGADGMLGRRLVTGLELGGRCVWASTRRRTRLGDREIFLDLAEPACEPQLPLNSIETAVLCAGATSMERCRLEPAATRRINVENTIALARRLVDAGVFVVFLSSNAVFDGQTAFPKAADRTNPQTEYGRQKAQAEEQLLRLGDGITVVRFSKIIPPDMPLISGWASDLRAGKVIHPFSDSVMAPVSSTFAVELLIRLVTRQLPGIVQASASNDMTYESAARYVAAKLTASVKLIEPISYTQMGISFVPKHTTLDASRLVEVQLEAPSPTHALDQLVLRAIR